MIPCPQCFTRNDETAAACVTCKAPLIRTACPQCCAVIPSSAHFCPSCGATLSGTTPTPPPPPPAHERETDEPSSPNVRSRDVLAELVVEQAPTAQQHALAAASRENHAPAPVVYGEFSERAIAVVIDAAILMISLPIVSFAAFQIGLPAWVVMAWYYILSTVYYIFFDSSPFRGTPGKMAMGLQIVDAKGQGISPGVATARFFSKFLSHYVFFIGYLMAIWDPQKQTLHDKIVQTFVIKTPPSR
jgi:uncharacterized RDD family membrane protein YckC